MANDKYKQGRQFENSVANRFNDRGFVVTRAAGSGTADRATPDLVAINRNAVILMECKTYSGDWKNEVVRYDREQQEKIQERVGCAAIYNSDPSRDIVTAIVMKCVDGGLPLWAVPDGEPIHTGTDAEPLFELVDKYADDNGDNHE